MTVLPYISGLGGTHLSPWERNFFTAHPPFGFILFDRNIVDAAQLMALTADLRLLTSTLGNAGNLATTPNKAKGNDVNPIHRPYIFIDQEGGCVRRLKPPLALPAPPMFAFTLLHRADPALANRALNLYAAIQASELYGFGIDSACSPVLDIRFEGAHDIIGDRAFGDKAEEVIAVVAPFLAALERHGLLTVMKHIPGHGRALVDSHHYLPRVAAKRALLEQTDFLPFQFFAHQAETRVPFAMTAHVVYEDIDPLWPATLSPLVMAMIRDHIGFNGLVMTDDLSMKALAQLEGKTMADRVRLALAAGCDLMLHCNGDRAEMTAVVETIRASDWRPADMEKKYQALAGYYEKIKSTSPTPLDERARLSAYQEMESLLLPYWQARH